MKKFLSIFIAVAMLMSFAGVFAGAPTAMAATTVTIDNLDSDLDYYSTIPSFGVGPGTTYDTLLDEYVYDMGDTILGHLDVAPTTAWTVELVTTAGAVVDTVNMAPGIVNFSIGTGNVSYDGEYNLRISSSTGEFSTFTAVDSVFIKYNLAPDPIDDFSFSECTVAGSEEISGWITRGSGQTVLVPVDVYLAYPDDTLAGYYTVAADSSGFFSITFPFDPVGNPTKYVGEYKIFIRDAYLDTNADNDAMIYQIIDNTPAAKSVTLSTYVSPSILYKDLAGQPFLVVATDGNGEYATGLSFTVEYNTGVAVTVTSFDEISPGFYKFYLTTDAVVGHGDVRFSSDALGDTYLASSNTVIVGLRDLAVFNPYVDVDAYYAIPTYGLGPWFDDVLARDVYDLLPCTIGNSLEIIVDSWPVAAGIASEWQVITEIPSVDGAKPVGGDKYLIEKAGKITASIYMLAWERINTACPLDGTNACCHELWTEPMLAATNTARHLKSVKLLPVRLTKFLWKMMTLCFPLTA